MSFEWTSRLFKPLDYLRVEHPAKRKYDLWIPLLVTIPIAGWALFSPVPFDIFGQDGLVSRTSGLLQILTGFYIASLAAVATFYRRGMDRLMAGEPPVLDVGKGPPEKLTRRRFLSLMFGYLALVSLLIYGIGVLAVLSVPSVKELLDGSFHWYAKAAFTTIYIFLFSNLLITTLLALFYMADRIHRHDPNVRVADENSATTDDK